MDPIVFEMPFRVAYANGESMIVEDENEARVLAAAKGGSYSRLKTVVPGLQNFGLPKTLSKPIETTHRGVVRLLWRVCNKSALVCRNPHQIVESGLLPASEVGIELGDGVGPEMVGDSEPVPPAELPMEPEDRMLSLGVPDFYSMTKRELRDYGDANGIHVKMSMTRDEMAEVLREETKNQRLLFAEKAEKK
jgi:hypothetical protein